MRTTDIKSESVNVDVHQIIVTMSKKKSITTQFHRDLKNYERMQTQYGERVKLFELTRTEKIN